MAVSWMLHVGNSCNTGKTFADFSQSEGSNGRALSSDGFAGNTMTIESCVAYCNSKNYFYAGTEYSGECCMTALWSWSPFPIISNLTNEFLNQTAEILLTPVQFQRLQLNATWHALEIKQSNVGGLADLPCSLRRELHLYHLP
jgi:WSC domain-containing protein